MSAPLEAAGRYISEVSLILASVTLAIYTFSLIYTEIFFESSRFSIRAISSRISPLAFANLNKSSSSNSFKRILKSFCWVINSNFLAARSGLSLSTIKYSN